MDTKQAMEIKYKTIEVERHELGNKELDEALRDFSLKFPQKDVYFECQKDKFTAHIRELDLLEFKDTINLLISKHHLKNEPFLKIIEQIENIKSYGLKGKKRIFVDYNKERKVKGRKQKEEKRGIYYYAQDNTFKKENCEIPTEFENKIICGDSEQILKKLPDNCVDLVFTSPPYNFGLDYHKQDDDHIWEHYFDKLFKIFDECIRVLKYGGRIIVNVQPLFSDYIPSHHIISNFFICRKLIWKGEILWEKNNYNCKYTAWGSWKSPSNPYFKYTWEFLEIFTKGTLKKEGSKEKIDITADEFKKWVVSRWSIAPERNMKKYSHPAMFPEELVARVLKLFSYKDDLILDPFNGAGSTTAVARRLQRRYLGLDISDEYCKTAIDRINETLF